ncbi:MAG: sugar phosphate nucleotidyltransferase [Actinomycetota bacterium]|nr:sugar phosphate nucleotidyltransferase [Actinomycetota bacterium]
MRALALILAGGAGGRMEVLTEGRAKPVLPFAGVYRLIDFPLSNCRHSGLSDVWVVQQYEPQSLNDHLVNGRPWDLDRTYGGLRLLSPQLGSSETGGWHQGNADALFKNRGLIGEFDPEVLVVLSADHVYKLDYRQVIAFHDEVDADVTVVTTTVPQEEASRFATVEAGEDGRVHRFLYKPDEPPTGVVSTEVFLYKPDTLLALLDRLGKEHGDELPEDYGESLLPTLVDEARAYEWRFDGYWQDVGTVSAYWSAHLRLVREGEPDLDEQHWPILTLAPQRPPARLDPLASVDTALVSPGCRVAGRVIRSVLGPGTVVEEGATVRDSVLFDDCVVARDASVDTAILDRNAHVGEGARVGAEGAGPEGVVLVAAEAKITNGSRVDPGARVARGSNREHGR